MISYRIERIKHQQRSNLWNSRGLQQGCTVWLTGLSGAGKSAIAYSLEKYLVSVQLPAYSLDADIIRRGLNSNLEYSFSSCQENVRRVGEVAKLFTDSGMICLVSFISPYENGREHARKIHDDEQLPFIEVYVNTPISTCELRDVKGLYRKARTGEITNLVGIQIPYEAPKNPDVIIDTTEISVDEAVQMILDKLVERAILSPMSGFLIRELFISNDQKDMTYYDFSNLSKLEVSLCDLKWIHILSEGWATPLSGFMRENEYLRCIHFTNEIQTRFGSQIMPIVLTCSNEDKLRIQSLSIITLAYEGKVIALLKNYECFKSCKHDQYVHTNESFEMGHRDMKGLVDVHQWLIGGDLEVIERIRWNDGLDSFRFTPKELKKQFHNIKADVVYAYGIEGPINNGHLISIKTAQEILFGRGYKNPILLLHPLNFHNKNESIPLDILLTQYQAYIDSLKAIITIFPSLINSNESDILQFNGKMYSLAGVEIVIVNRDRSHLYKSGKITENSFNIELLSLETVAYHHPTRKMATYDSNKHEEFTYLSNVQMKNFALADQQLPEGFMLPEAWQILSKYYQIHDKRIETLN